MSPCSRHRVQWQREGETNVEEKGRQDLQNSPGRPTDGVDGRGLNIRPGLSLGGDENLNLALRDLTLHLDARQRCVLSNDAGTLD